MNGHNTAYNRQNLMKLEQLTMLNNYAFKLALASLLTIASALPAFPMDSNTETEALKRQLAAQKAINQQLLDRVKTLEKQLAAANPAQPVLISLDSNAEKPPLDANTDDNSAIEQFLGSKGLVLLPTGSARLTPGVSWSHGGADHAWQDGYVFSVGADVGLPLGMMFSASVPWERYDNDLGGSANGMGDITASLSKKLTNDTTSTPSLIAQLAYTHDTGDAAISSGYRSLRATLNAVKRYDPVVFYGGLSYNYALDSGMDIKDDSGTLLGQAQNRDNTGVRIGVSLAATPDIALDAGLSLTFWEKGQFTPVADYPFDTPRATIGYMNLGSSFVLAKGLSLNLSAAAGVTEEASDLVVTASMPYRF